LFLLYILLKNHFSFGICGVGVVFAVVCVENSVWSAVVMDKGLHVCRRSTGTSNWMLTMQSNIIDVVFIEDGSHFYFYFPDGS